MKAARQGKNPVSNMTQLAFRGFAAPVVTPLSDHQVSPLVLSDRLLTLAQDAERAGFPLSAGHLVSLAHAVFDEIPTRR
jgi:hypothetical protein